MIRVHNLRSAGFVNDPTAVDADVDHVEGDVVTLLGVVTLAYSGRHPVLSFDEETSERFKAQDVCTERDIIKAMETAVERR